MSQYTIGKDILVETDVAVPMRDGVTLYADIYRPLDLEEPLPAILQRTPYDKRIGGSSYAHPSWFARHGYVVVVQDTRGRWRSEGDFYPFLYEEQDGYDTVEWVAALPYVDGKVGMIGISYHGATQLLAAVARPPHLRCIVPCMTGSDYYRGWTYRGGALLLAFAESWALLLSENIARRKKLGNLEYALHQDFLNIPSWTRFLPLKDFPPLKRPEIPPFFFDWITHSTYDEYWKRWSIERRHHQIAVPALHVGGWYDIFLDGTLRNFTGLQEKGATPEAREGQKLIIGPWYHTTWGRQVGEIDFGEEAKNRISYEIIRWCDRWLKGKENQVDAEPAVTLFVMGENRWRTESEWPPARTRYVNYYLHSRGYANSLNGDGVLDTTPPTLEPPDVYPYAPQTPTPSFGGRSCCDPAITPMGPADQRVVEKAGTVLVYTGAPLESPLEVTGPIQATIWAATDVVDTDFTVKLLDVYPDGRAINIADGIIRARFRDSLESPSLLEPHRIYRYTIDLTATSNLFLPGHAIRVEVASSHFPQYDANPNTGRPLGEDSRSDGITATQVIYHDALHPSHITLPVIPR
ncbi:MAG: CocE/NonD family hydrolase [Nitrospinota bacterium]|nr:MAG: CocE/NonD family hydrolase [Nitrospinota bacterium]